MCDEVDICNTSKNYEAPKKVESNYNFLEKVDDTADETGCPMQSSICSICR